MNTLITMPEPGQESLVQAYLPLLEQWEAQGLVEATVGKLRRPISFWLLSASCTSRWRAIVLGQWSFCSGASMSVTVTALFLLQSQATAPWATVVSSLGPPALSGNPWTGGVPLRRSLPFAPLGLAPALGVVQGNSARSACHTRI